MVGDALPPPQDVQATYCATLVDEWIHLGVRHAVIAPGSRSTPMAVALTDRPEVAVHVVHDERVAAFVALGLGLDGAPALLLCTSGTAAANFFPAVVEAGLSEVPMIVLTADRPEELRGVGAPQTIDQIDLYGRHAVWFSDAGVPDHAARSQWRSLAREAWRHAALGPAHLNLPFREPLLGRALDMPPAEPAAPEAVGAPRGGDAAPDLASERGLIVVGGRSGVAVADIVELRERTGWPIVADPLSGLRGTEGLADVVSTADAMLRHEGFAGAHLPDVIVRIGRPASSKVLAAWLRRATDAGAVMVQVGGPGTIDPDRNVAAVCVMDSVLEAASRGRPANESWAAAWRLADDVADAAILATLESFEELTEPHVARLVAEHLPPDGCLTVASSMPVRDLEWFGGRHARAHANRGANGIDGVASTALGRALAGRPSVLLIGDLAVVHDANALVGLVGRGVDLRIVVVDNDGGGIFSFLPQATALDHDRFERLFGTPLGVDVVALATAYGIDARSVERADELVEQLGVPGPWLACVPSDRVRNVVVHDVLHAAVAAALDAALAAGEPRPG
jgi:2-succinyl-5-enolpyruvyl-6-hydroxy-3-cyclohexene-1-carboxylate synthase